MRHLCVRLAALIPILAACARQGEARATRATDSTHVDSVARARQDSVNRTLPGYVVDSIRPVEEELRRFRDAVGGGPVSAFVGGSDSRESLVRAFLTGLAARDTVTLLQMVLGAREFADLVYPESPYVRPPYQQAVGLVWSQIQNPSESGFRRLVRRLGGEPLHLIGLSCPNAPEHQGRNVIWTGCVVQLRNPDGALSTHRLFGSIIARAGRFKLVSFASEF